MKLQINEIASAKKIQLLYLLLGGGTVFLFVFVDAFFPGIGYFLAEKYLALPCLLFLGSALNQRLTTSAKVSLLLSAAAVLWFAAVQMQHHLTNMGTRSFGIFAFVYLLGFPYAAVTHDSRENTGLKWIGKIYIASTMVLISCIGLLLMDAVPEILTASIGWDGARVAVIWHPNAAACALMLGIGFSLYFLTCAKRKWVKFLMATLLILQFIAITLTNSRTSILLACGLVGGTMFFQIWKGGLKRFLIALAVALVVIFALFTLSGNIFDMHTQHQLKQLIAQTETAGGDTSRLKIDEATGEVSIAAQSEQGELKEDLKTLNSRTIIWGGAFKAMNDNPVLKRWGTEYVTAEISSRTGFLIGHAHNSWIQVWMLLGTPAFLISMVYTLLAVVNAFWLMFRKNIDLSKKVVAMLVLCVLAASFMESYLFAGEMKTSFINFIFFFCTGYLIQWNVEASAKA